ncbi:MAG TPA: hypothetical protein VD706_01865 [Candidatus Saccharimonadales bacterium]|nr:hypothetical protein [Candidatus Saccharimonadales bacterium]
MNSIRVFQTAAWSLSIVTTMLSILAWGQDFNWQLSFNAYVIFPVLGLAAYGIMWSHYIAGTAREIFRLDKKVLAGYYRLTGFLVLVLICLHPGLLIYQRFRDGFGLPPQSYETYVGPGLGWVTLLGTASLLVFLAYEFHRKFGERTWWHFVTEAGDIAMLAIFYHGLRLGLQLQDGRFRYVWWFYGVTLVAVLIRSYGIRYLLPALSKSKSPARK